MFAHRSARRDAFMPSVTLARSAVVRSPSSSCSSRSMTMATSAPPKASESSIHSASVMTLSRFMLEQSMKNQCHDCYARPCTSSCAANVRTGQANGCCALALPEPDYQELEALMSSIQIACKMIANLVTMTDTRTAYYVYRRSSLSNLRQLRHQSVSTAPKQLIARSANNYRRLKDQ
eukprot:17546-Heterococcus_DN1.PRE.2